MQTLADQLSRGDLRRNALVRDAALILGGSLLVALSAKIQAPFGLIPFTLQPFAVLLVAAALGARRGALAMIAYLLEGAIGLPVFAAPIAGPAYFVGPTAGYLLAFPLAAYVVGLLAERGWDRRLPSAALAMAAGQALILAFGFAWLSFFVGPKTAFFDGVAKFLLGDLLKIVLAALALPAAWKLITALQRDQQES